MVEGLFVLSTARVAARAAGGGGSDVVPDDLEDHVLDLVLASNSGRDEARRARRARDVVQSDADTWGFLRQRRETAAWVSASPRRTAALEAAPRCGRGARVGVGVGVGV